MKMDSLNSGIIFGIIIILFGVSILLRHIFNIHFPIFKIVFGCLLIFLGAKMLLGSFGFSSGSHSAIFSESSHVYKQGAGEFNVVFGKSVLDLRNSKIGKSENLKINTVFGEYVILINDSVPLEIVTNVVFGNVVMPDSKNAAFGKNTYKTSEFSEDIPHLTIEANVVFGNMKIENN